MDEVQTVDEKDPNDKKWYEFNITVPLFISSFPDYTMAFVTYVIFNVFLILIALIPFRILDGFQSCLISAMGTFFFAIHLLARPLAAIPVIVDFILWCLGLALAIVAAVFSVNEKFSNLFLSIGGGYITSSFLVALIGFKHYLIYLLTFVVFFVGFVILKKKNAMIHYSLVKSFVLSFAITMCVDLATPIKLFKALYGETGEVKSVHKYIGYTMLVIEIILIFTYTYHKPKIQAAVSKK